MTSEGKLERRVRRLGNILKSLQEFHNQPEEFLTAMEYLEEEVIATREDAESELKLETEDMKEAEKYREETKEQEEPEDTVPDLDGNWPF